MSEKRRDKRGRILRNGEMQLPNGKYRFKYVDNLGKERFLYSWRLDRNDPVPSGKKKCQSLREMERQVQADLFDHIVCNGGNLTVLELVEKYVSTKIGVRPNTAAGYKTVINFLKKDPFGARRIDTVKLSDAKLWLIKLQQVDKKSYSSIHSIRGVLNPAFRMAVDDDLIRKNPFGFELATVVVNDSVTRDALTRDQERKFLKFVQEDKHFCRYYEGIYILFKTGLRISEFCGLTISDIDFENHSIRVERQLQKRGSFGYYIEDTKTTAGERTLPMTPDVEECFQKIIENRNPPKAEPMVDGVVGFLYFDKDSNICYSLHWEHYFRHIVDKYNSIYKVQMPRVTPHVCRHTYCSNMAKSGMNPKALQYLMGHSDIGVTLNTYTHVKFEDAKAEVIRLKKAI
ncbi:MAG: site-specific integrase [Clostridiales bacterium]|nr:site-specific integrase [Candidatus Crickella caballi]